MCLILGIIILASTTKIQLVLCSQCNIGAPVFSAKFSMYLLMDLVLLTVLYIHLISTSVDSEAIDG